MRLMLRMCLALVVAGCGATAPWSIAREARLDEVGSGGPSPLAPTIPTPPLTLGQAAGRMVPLG